MATGHETALVTGGTGFVGHQVVQSLLEGRVGVRALVRSTSDGRAVSRLRNLGAEVVQGDLLRPETYREALRGAAYVFHSAAVHRTWTDDPPGLYRVNVEGTRNLFEEAQRAGVEQFIHTSSVKTIGVPPGEAISDEQTAYNLWDLDGDYGRSKVLAERLLLEQAGGPIQIKVLNPAAVIGPGDLSPTPTMDLLKRCCQGRSRAYIDTRLGLVDVRDVGRAHLLALTRARPGRRYILCAQNLTLHELFLRVSRLAGVKRPWPMVPYGLAYPVAWTCQAAAALTHRPPAVTSRSLGIARLKPGYDGRLAAEELGLNYRSLDETLRDSVDWLLGRSGPGRG